MKIAVLNVSYPVYNLATEKIANYHRALGDDVYTGSATDFFCLNVDKAYLSAIFTWDLPQLVDHVNLLRKRGIRVEIGGPAPTALPEYVLSKCGIAPFIGLDDRFEHVNGGNYKMVFTSRGCIRKCPWCVSHLIEPKNQEYNDFPIPVGKNPYVGDNCLLATSWEHQELVVKRLKDVRNLDINSGFDCRLFTEEHYQLYSKLHLEAWRLAFDSMGVEAAFEKAVAILKKHKVDYRRILVYVLINYPGTTFEECVYRLERVRELGCSPYPQKYAPLNTVNARNFVAPGFEKEKIDQLRAYWCNPFAWRTCTWEEFKSKYKPVLEGEKML